MTVLSPQRTLSGYAFTEKKKCSYGVNVVKLNSVCFGLTRWSVAFVLSVVKIWLDLSDCFTTEDTERLRLHREGKYK